jgi:hypothetical protein
VTAAGVLFKALAILSRPLFSFAIVFIALTSSLDHRTRFLFCLGISTPLLGARLLETDLIHVKLVFLQTASLLCFSSAAQNNGFPESRSELLATNVDTSASVSGILSYLPPAGAGAKALPAMRGAIDCRRLTTSNLRHAEDHMLLLGRKNALERVAAFLIEMDRRSAAAGILALPMGRRDIADYLGLTLETVSRALSRLHDLGILGFIGNTHRRIVLLDREKLASLDLQH